MKPGRSAAVKKRARKTDLFNEGTARGECRKADASWRESNYNDLGEPVD
jgi:hypothetical protein